MKTSSFFVSILFAASIVTQVPLLAQAYRYEDIKLSTDIFDTVDDSAIQALSENDVVRANLTNFIRRGYRLNMDPVIRNKTASFLVRIESSYYDEALKQWRLVTGLGSVVKLNLNGRDVSAVLSVSHLTQGQKLRIYDLKGQSLPIVPGQRFANINEDLELIVLKDRLETPLEYKGALGFISKIYDLGNGVVPSDYEVTDYDRIYVAKKQHVPILKSMLPKGSKGQDRVAHDVDRENTAQKIVQRGVRGLDLITAFWNEDGVLQKQFLGNGYVGNARMMPGLSGAPLIRDIPFSAAVERGIYYYSIEGLVQGHHLFENKSYFVGSKSIINLVDGFLKGQRGYTSAARWRLKNGMTFRDYGNGVLETNLVKTPSSSFFKGDSGNAVSVDGFVQRDFVHIGMQNGFNSIEVGRFLKTQERIIPVLADPHMNIELPKGFASGLSFDANQDLLKLAQMKYQFRDKFTNQIDIYKCFYQVTNAGINLQLLKKDQTVASWSRSSAELVQGFKQNSFFIPGSAQAPALEVSGLFITDLSSVSGSIDSVSHGAPTITVLPFEKTAAQRIGCYTDQAQMDKALNQLNDELRALMQK